MAHDYIPRRDFDFLNWSRVFSARINSSPEAVGLTPLLASQYAALHDAYVAAYNASRDRAVPAIETKKTARKAAEKQARLLARIIQAHPETTNSIRAALSITVPDPELTKVAQPTDAPNVKVKLREGTTVRVKLLDDNAIGRALPDGVAGAKVFSYIGERPPAMLRDWRHECLVTRPWADINLEHNIKPGTTVWITACWYNNRGQSGPHAVPVYTIVQGYLSMQPKEQEMALAA